MKQKLYGFILMVGKDVHGDDNRNCVTLRGIGHFERQHVYGRWYSGDFPTMNTNITNSTISRISRAQMRLAGLPVSGWPFGDTVPCPLCGEQVSTDNENLKGFC